MTAPHLDLRKQIPDTKFDILGLFSKYGFEMSLDFRVYDEIEELVVPAFRNSLALESFLPFQSQSCYMIGFSSFRKKDSFDKLSFFTPRFKRFRHSNPSQITHNSLEEMCRELDEKMPLAHIKKIVLFPEVSSTDENGSQKFTYEAKVFNIGEYEIGGNKAIRIPRSELERLI